MKREVVVFHDEQDWISKAHGDSSATADLHEVFRYETDVEDDLVACEEAFHLFNVGDDPTFGEPDPRALEYRSKWLRSLSVGDVVEIDGRRHRCASMGWEPQE